MAWQEDLDEARARLAGLDPDRALASARAAAVTWRRVESFSAFFLPLPPVAQDVPSVGGAWTEDDGDGVGLDAAGRPVVHLLDPGERWERAKHLWWWDDDGSFVELELMGSGPHVRRARVVDGRLAHVATASSHDRLGVRLVTWRDGR
ncbi:MAG: hypothetical protein HZB46_10955, partial [Solirubrobacterales bacterium]|nr:hypothetical protein [Solirubrobacterales bacterium]